MWHSCGRFTCTSFPWTIQFLGATETLEVSVYIQTIEFRCVTALVEIIKSQTLPPRSRFLIVLDLLIAYVTHVESYALGNW
jgi:hypothetical protein